MNFKVSVETNDVAGIEVIINQIHALEQKGDKAEKQLTTSTPELIQTTTEQIYPAAPDTASIQQPAYTTYAPQYSQSAPPIQAPPVQQAPIAQPQIQQTPIAPPITTTKQYSMQDLSLATRPIVEAGRQQEVVDFLHSFKKADGTPVQTIMDVPVEMYGAFAQGLRQLGGKI